MVKESLAKSARSPGPPPPAGRAGRGLRPCGLRASRVDTRPVNGTCWRLAKTRRRRGGYRREENQIGGPMSTIADTAPAPGQLIRWHYLGYAVLALGVMTVAIASHDHWFLNFVHVICGVLWTGIDLFMGFVIGPILRKVDLSVRREIILRLVPRTLVLMPTLSIITGTTGWFLAEDL